eukprot:m.215791 g.215791  ORF g.215791 m.215791 type:complete len:516 (+) comp18645_c0_seq7:266-1813(+)
MSVNEPGHSRHYQTFGGLQATDDGDEVYIPEQGVDSMGPLLTQSTPLRRSPRRGLVRGLRASTKDREQFQQRWDDVGPWARVFVFLGALLTLVATVLIIVSQNAKSMGGFHPGDAPREGRTIFSCLIQITFFIWVCGVDLEVLHKGGINVGSLLVRDVGQYQEPIHPAAFFKLAALLSYVFVAGLATYIGVFWFPHDRERTAPVAPVVVQFLVFAIVLLPVVLPWPLPLWKRRKAFFWRVLQCFSCVFGYPVLSAGKLTFYHTIITDALTSLTLFIFEFDYSFCHFFTSNWSDRKVFGSDGSLQKDYHCGEDSTHHSYIKPTLYVLPIWLRFVQCIWNFINGYRTATSRWNRYSHLANAAKYVSAMMVVLTSSAQGLTSGETREYWRAAWIGSMVIKTLYCYLWDVYMDWGLGDVDAGFLRERLVYPKWMYYIALVTNFFARISWALAISPHFCEVSCKLFFGLVEIARRGQWSIIRVENEFLTLCRKENINPNDSRHSLSRRTSSSSVVKFEDA